jgi:D-sedoheptulose 7-phosphate isomerase
MKTKLSRESIKSVWLENLKSSEQTLKAFINSEEQIKKTMLFSEILISAYQNQGTVFTCGNGGSHCDAMHFAEEMTGRYRKDRPPLAALALGDASHVTCVSNDYGFEYVFSRQLEALSRPGDVLIGLSTSGQSKNVIKAFESAKKKNLKTIALLGRDGGLIKDMVDLAIVIPEKTSDRIQEMHIKLLHMVIETVEREFFPENY